MSNFLKKILSSKSSSKDLTKEKKFEEQHTTSSSEGDVTNESIQIAKVENDFLNWKIPKLDSKTIYFQNTFNFKKNLCKNC